MTPERYQLVKALFYEAQELEPDARAELLDQRCGEDQQLRHAVDQLLASAEKMEDFIEKPAYAVIADSLANDVLPSLMEGKRIGPYEVVRRLGEGGMGTVYLARRADDVYEKQVAIKLIRRGLDHSRLISHFYNERQILAGLDHPNIARLLDGGTTEDGLPYYVMEYVVGEPFLDYCNRKNLTTDDRLRLFRTICSAVQHAHQNLVIHRDLKPNNILVTADGNPKLLDFGIAKVFNGNGPAAREAETVTEFRVMTPEYASPEQITGQPVTTASDIYSLGVILYQLLTGQRPYRFRSHLPHDIAKAICETEPEKPSRAGRSASPFDRDGEVGARAAQHPRPNVRNQKSLRGDLDNIILIALRKEPHRRYATVDQFSEDIRRHLAGLPVMARRDTLAYRTTKFVKRNRYGVAAAAVILILMLAGVAGIVRQTRIVTAERDRARTEQVKAERINKFFQDMLARANVRWYAPGSGKKPDITVIDALNEASTRIENELNDEPAVKAEILTTIGDTFGALGRVDLSIRPFELALELRRKLFGNEDIKVAESLYYLAGAKSLTNKKDEAAVLFQQALAIQRRRPNEGNNLPYMLLDYGDLLNWQGDREAARAHFLEALEIFKQRHGPGHFTVGVALDYVGKSNLERGEAAEAEKHYREALRIFGDATNANVARAHERLGQVLVMKKNYEEAEFHFRRALEIVLLSADESDWSALTIRMQFAGLACLKGKCGEAKAEMERMLAESKKRFAADGLEVAAVLHNLGLVLTRNAEPKRGETYLRQSHEIWQRKSPSPRSSAVSFKHALGESLLAQKRYAEAEPLLLEVYHHFKGNDVPDSPRIQSARELLEKLYQAWGKQDKGVLG